MNFLKFVDRFFGKFYASPSKRLSDEIDDRTFRKELKEKIEEEWKNRRITRYIRKNYDSFKNYKLFRIH